MIDDVQEKCPHDVSKLRFIKSQCTNPRMPMRALPQAAVPIFSHGAAGERGLPELQSIASQWTAMQCYLERQYQNSFIAPVREHYQEKTFPSADAYPSSATLRSRTEIPLTYANARELLENKKPPSSRWRSIYPRVATLTHQNIEHHHNTAEAQFPVTRQSFLSYISHKRSEVCNLTKKTIIPPRSIYLTEASNLHPYIHTYRNKLNNTNERITFSNRRITPTISAASVLTASSYHHLTDIGLGRDTSGRSRLEMRLDTSHFCR